MPTCRIKTPSSAASFPAALPHWNEDRFQMLTRVIDAITYDQKPGMKLVMVAEYLSRASQRVIPALMRRRRRPRRKAPRSAAKR